MILNGCYPTELDVINNGMTRATILLYILSGTFLAGITPIFNCWPMAFCAFVPMLVAINYDFKSGEYTYPLLFIKGLLTGAIFAVSCLYWIADLSILGLILSIAIIASFFGLFCMGVLFGLESGLIGWKLGLWTTFIWVALEAVGSDLFFNIPSLAIGYSLWSVPLFIQIADITGVFGISFWIVMINTCIAQCLYRGVKIDSRYVMAAMFLTMSVIGYGVWNHYIHVERPRDDLSLLLLYTSVTKKQRAEVGFPGKIFGIFEKKTREAIQALGETPDLIVWPETSLPVYLRTIRSKKLIEDLLSLSKKSGSPILLGARSFKRETNGSLKLYNAAFIIPKSGYIRQEYRKVILAPFVETSPFIKWLPQWLQKTFESKLEAGNEPGIMATNDKNNIGIAICYEALFPNFIRKCVNLGAGIIVNITNDQTAFKKFYRAYKLPIPHIVFRAIENRRAVIRCANWGISLLVTPQGKIIRTSDVGESGFLHGKILTIDRKTLFTRYGFFITKLLFGGTCLWSVLLFAKRLKDKFQ